MSKRLLPATDGSAYPSGSRLRDEESRRRKALKILAVLRDAVGGELKGLRCLDVGCAAGLISYHLAGDLGQVVGLDPDGAALRLAPRRDNLCLLQGDALCLPFPAGSFDVAICAQVYEHTTDPQRMMAEIHRVLKDDGMCFFSGPNKLFPLEYHYGLLFLHWLPVSWASWILRKTGRGQAYDEKPLTRGQLLRLLRGFSIEDYTVAMLRDPDRFFAREEVPLANIVRRMPAVVWRLLYDLLPNYNWLLRKDRQR
jgi:SAM-dependent methyltransferase